MPFRDYVHVIASGRVSVLWWLVAGIGGYLSIVLVQCVNGNSISSTDILTATCELADRGPHTFATILLWVDMAQLKLVMVGNIFANPL